jgi:hypothetical protein
VCALGLQGMPNTESTEYTERKKTAELFQCVYDRHPQFVAMVTLRGTELFQEKIILNIFWRGGVMREGRAHHFGGK